MRLGVGFAIALVVQQPILRVAFFAEGELQGILPLGHQRVALLRALGRGIVELRQLIVQRIERAKHAAELVGRGVEELELRKICAQGAGVVRVTQKEFLQLRRRENGGEFLPGLLPKPGKFGGLRVFPGPALGGEIFLDAIGGVQTDLFDRLFDIGGQRAEDRAIQGNRHARRARQADKIPALPVRSEQGNEQIAAFGVQFAIFRAGGLGDDGSGSARHHC